MSYERPSAEVSSTGKDDKDKTSRKKRSVEAALAQTITSAEVADTKAEAPEPKRAWELGRLVGRIVPEPKAETAPMNPFDVLAPRTEEKKSNAEAPAERGNDQAGLAEAKENTSAEQTEARPSAEEPIGNTGAEAHNDQHVEANEDEELARIESDEHPEVVNRLIEPRLEEVHAEQEQAEPDSVEAKAAEADAAFLEEVQAQVNDGTDLEEATAAAFPKVMGVEAPPLPEAEEEGASETEPEEGQTTEHEANTTPLEALDFPAAQNTTEDDPYAAPYAAGYAGGASGGYGGAGTVTPGFAGGYGGSGAMGGTAGGAAAYRGRERVSREPKVEVNGVASGLLVGGIVGYLLGRRRGRIKTERRLLPVQRELEKQVQSLHDHLAVREAQVRKLVWEHAAEQSAPVATPEVARAAVPAQAREAAPSVEHAKPAASSEKLVVKTEAARPKPEDAKHMELPKLVEIAEEIPVSGLTVKRVYEVGLIKEHGLRKVVEEYLRGGEIQSVLNEAILEQEKSYELDPYMNRYADEAERASSVAQAQGGAAGAGAASSPFVQQASMDVPHVDKPTQYSPVNQQQPVNSALVVANIAALAVLAILLIILLFVWLTR